MCVYITIYILHNGQNVQCIQYFWNVSSIMRIMYTMLHYALVGLILYVMSAFPKCVNRHSKEMGFKCQYQAHKLCFGKKLFTFVYMLVYLYIYEEFFSETRSMKLAFALRTRFFDWHLTAIWKRALHMYIHVVHPMYIALRFQYMCYI